jgi:TolB-like protein
VSDPASFVDGLKSRKVVQWAVAYLSAAWLLLQLVDVVGDQFELPGAVLRAITVMLGLGLMPTLVLAWFHGEKGQQRVTRLELLLLVVILLGAGAVINAVRGTGAAAEATTGIAGIVRDPAALVILPFGTTAPDSVLDRLGRDLVVTIGATLDGIDGIRVIDPLTLLAHVSRDGNAVSAERAHMLADRLGAARVLYGTLARSGSRVRLDAALYAVGGARPLARVSLEQDAERVSAITDSVVFSLVRQLWKGATPDIPSPAALATSSAAALHAYLEGEHALANAEMAEALAAFERAFTIDSTYWFAYWRSLYPRTYEGGRPDSAALARVIDNRDKLPPADRLLVDVSLEHSARRQLALLEDGVRRFPTHWPMWYTYANLLVHWTPYIGTDADAARAALDRVIQLNPRFAPAWEHRLWVAGMQEDTAAFAATLRHIESIVTSGGQLNEDQLTYYRSIQDANMNGGVMSGRLLTHFAGVVVNYRGLIPPRAFGTGHVIAGRPLAQIQLADAVLALDPGSELGAAMWQGRTLAWVGRGAWDSAAVSAAHWTRVDGSARAALSVYGLFAAGAAYGAVTAADAARYRPGNVPADAMPAWRGELAWADGVIAYSRGDATELAEARRRLTASGARQLPLLGGSLDALALALRGRTGDAARSLSTAEERAADAFEHRAYGHNHPYVTAVNRVLAAQWLLETGDAAAAARLLTFSFAVLPSTTQLEAANRTVGNQALYFRGRAAEALGRPAEARAHYERFILRFDRPVPALDPLISDARARLQRLARPDG